MPESSRGEVLRLLRVTGIHLAVRCAAITAVALLGVGVILLGEWIGARLLPDRGGAVIGGLLAGALVFLLIRLFWPRLAAAIVFPYLWILMGAAQHAHAPAEPGQRRPARTAIAARSRGVVELDDTDRLIGLAHVDLLGLVQGLAGVLPGPARRDTGLTRLWLWLIAREAGSLGMGRALAGPEAAHGAGLRTAARAAVVLSAQAARDLVAALARPVALGWTVTLLAGIAMLWPAHALVSLVPGYGVSATVLVAALFAWALRLGFVGPLVQLVLVPRHVACLADRAPHLDWENRLDTSSAAFRALAQPPAARAYRPPPAGARLRRSGR